MRPSSAARPATPRTAGASASWHAWPQNDGDSIEWSAPYPATRTMTTLTAVNATTIRTLRRVAGDRKSMTNHSPRRAGLPHQPAVLEPHAERNQQQPEHEHRRQRDEDDERRVGVVEETEQERDEKGDENHRARRGQHDARQRSGCRARARLGTHDALFLQALHVGDERVDVRRPEACRTSSASAVSWWSSPSWPSRPDRRSTGGSHQPRASIQRRRADSPCRPCRRWNGTPSTSGPRRPARPF